MKHIYKFYSYTKNQGLAKASEKTIGFFAKKIKLSKTPIDVMADIEDIVRADFYAKPYKKPAVVKSDKLRIAWILSPLTPGSGGQNTITRFARYLQDKGHPTTIYIYEGIQPQMASTAAKILRDSFNLDVSVKSINNFTDADVVIATGWETAYPAFNLNTNAHKFYFVQDFEPMFYGVGSKSVLAENTYKMGFYGITAGRWLTSKLHNDFNMNSDYFDFGVDVDIYRPKSISSIKKQKKIVFYARPVTERRAFELGVIALDIFHKKHPEYSIEFIGWDVSDYVIPFPYVNRGILTHQELATLYQESVAGLVLSLTNSSLLPFELLAAGCIPIINEGDNNRMVLGENDYIQYAQASPAQLADQIIKTISHADIDVIARQACDSVANLPWEKSYKKMEKILLREVKNV